MAIPNAAADLARRVVQRRRDALLLDREGGCDRRRRRRAGQAHADREEHDADEEEPVGRIGLEQAEEPEADGHGEQPDRRDPAEADPLRDVRRVAGDRQQDERQRQHGHGSFERRALGDELQVLQDDEEEAERGEELDGDRQRAGGQAPKPEDARVEHRLAQPQLPEHEPDECDEADASAAIVSGSSQPRSGPSMIPNTVPPTASERQDGADPVERRRSLVRRARDDGDDPDERDRRQGHIQAEERLPREELEQQCAAEEPEHRPAAGDPHPHADGPRPLLDREGGGDDRQGGRHDRRRTDAHRGPQRDQLLPAR